MLYLFFHFFPMFLLSLLERLIFQFSFYDLFSVKNPNKNIREYIRNSKH